jgi:F420-dependent oxidoreductase-like protein
VEYCVFTEPHLGANYDHQLAYAQAAERLGFDGFFRSDHYRGGGAGEALPGPTDAWITLAGLARETSSIRLGTLVTPATFRLPGVLAIQVAQVDQMSGGRIELGLGTGWMEAEHTAYGIPFPPKRFGLLEEQLEIVTGLWSAPIDEGYSFTGRHYSLSGAPALPKPVQESVPIIIGGGGATRTPKLVARFAREYNVGFPTVEQIRERIANLEAACARVGRDPQSVRLSLAMSTIVGADDAELEHRAGRIGSTLEKVRDGVNIVGGRDEIAERMEVYARLGIERVYFQLLDQQDVTQVEFLGSEVLPHLPR